MKLVAKNNRELKEGSIVRDDEGDECWIYNIDPVRLTFEYEVQSTGMSYKCDGYNSLNLKWKK